MSELWYFNEQEHQELVGQYKEAVTASLLPTELLGERPTPRAIRILIARSIETDLEKIAPPSVIRKLYAEAKEGAEVEKISRFAD